MTSACANTIQVIDMVGLKVNFNIKYPDGSRYIGGRVIRR